MSTISNVPPSVPPEEGQKIQPYPFPGREPFPVPKEGEPIPSYPFPVEGRPPTPIESTQPTGFNKELMDAANDPNLTDEEIIKKINDIKAEISKWHDNTKIELETSNATPDQLEALETITKQQLTNADILIAQHTRPFGM